MGWLDRCSTRLLQNTFALSPSSPYVCPVPRPGPKRDDDRKKRMPSGYGVGGECSDVSGYHSE